MAEDVAVSDFDGLYAKFTAAFEGEDYDALRAMCASKAVMVNLAGVALTGRDAFVGFLQRAQRVQNLRFAVSDTSVLSDVAVRQVGSLTLTVRGEGREMQEVPATFLMLWVKADGQWQIDSCVWARLRTDGGGRAGGRGGRGGMGAGGRGMPGGAGRAPIRRPGPDGGGAFNPRDMGVRPDQVPLISRID